MDTAVTVVATLGHDDPSSLEPKSRRRAGATAATGLWLFMGVATMLFSLFALAYVLRLDGVDGYPLALPWQLWLSTALLATGGVALQLAGSAARRGRRSDAHALLLLGGALALAFLGVQL